MTADNYTLVRNFMIDTDSTIFCIKQYRTLLPLQPNQTTNNSNYPNMNMVDNLNLTIFQFLVKKMPSHKLHFINTFSKVSIIKLSSGFFIFVHQAAMLIPYDINNLSGNNNFARFDQFV